MESGIRYTYRAFDHDGDGRIEAYTINADAIDSSVSPLRRHFYSDQSAVIRFEPDKPAGPTSPLLQ